VIVPLAEWYPAMHRLWVAEGRRLHVPIEERKAFTVHHTDGGAGSDPLAYARRVADFHYHDRGWRRPGGYNFQIGTDGTVFEMCGWEWVGAHAPGCNYSTVGVSFQGRFHDRMPNDAQLSAFASLAGPAQQGHRDCSATSCPGDRLYRALPLQEDDMPDANEIARAVWGWTDNRTERSMQNLLRNAYEFAVIAARREIDGQVDVDELAEGLRGTLGDDLASEVVAALGRKLSG